MGSGCSHKSSITRPAINKLIHNAVDGVNGVLDNFHGAVGPVIENLPKLNPVPNN